LETGTQFLNGEINLAATLDCGQAFRWRREGGWFRGVIGNRVVWLRQVEEGVQWKCLPPTEDATFLAHYLALDNPLKKIIATFPDDPYFHEAVRQFYGMRMLRQEPWETLASFIASSTKQIVQIKQIVENLCAAFGEEIHNGDSLFCHPERSEGSLAVKRKEILRCAQNDKVGGVCAFPSPDKIASATHSELWDCKLGFRAKYLLATARRIDSGKLDLPALAKMETARAREELMKCDGVGEKIANCVLLFGYARHEACPIDVWIGRALQQLYFRKKRNVTPKKLKEFAQSYLGPNAGYAQQYLFHYVRVNPEVLKVNGD
jgi:N-glycosylase/DNA lyase